MKKAITFTALALLAGPAVAAGWTDWISRDVQSGNGDYEDKASLASGLVCDHPLKIEAKIVGQNTVYQPGDTVPDILSQFNTTHGLICVNRDQLTAGRSQCQDYTVRYYCAEREDLTKQFPVLNEVDRQNAVYSRGVRTYKSTKQVNLARMAAPSEDIPVITSYFRLGQGYDRLNDAYRNQCLDQTHPDFQIEQVPVTQPTLSEVRLVGSSDDLYRALNQSTTLGVNLGFTIDDTDIKFGLSTSSDLLQTEHFQDTRVVYTLTFEKVLSQYHLNTQPRPIKQSIVDGVTSSTEMGPLLEPYSDTHKQAFYRECGDRFLDGVSLGARLVAVFHYDATRFSEQRNKELKANIGAQIQNILTVGYNREAADAIQRELTAVGVKYDVYSFGGPAFPRTPDSISQLSEHLASFEQNLNEQNAVAIHEMHREYPLPAKYHNFSHYDIFADTRDYYLQARNYAAVSNTFAARCKSLKDYNNVIDTADGNFSTADCDSESLKGYIHYGRENCSLSSNWDDCRHPAEVTVRSGQSLLDVLDQKILAVRPESVISERIDRSVTGGVWNKKCIEEHIMTCLPTSCLANLNEGSGYGTGQGFTVNPWSYHSPANSGERGYVTFTKTLSGAQQCVKSDVKACTHKIGGSKANFIFQVEFDGVCPEAKSFPVY